MNAEWYECRDCGERFDFNRATRKKNPEFMVTSGERWTYGCPSCGSESWNDLDECGCCGSLFVDGESPCFGICPKCAEDAAKDLPMLRRHYDDKRKTERHLSQMFINFSDEEIENILFAEFSRRIEAGDIDALADVDGMIADNGHEIAETMRYEREEAGKAVVA